MSARLSSSLSPARCHWAVVAGALLAHCAGKPAETVAPSSAASVTEQAMHRTEPRSNPQLLRRPYDSPATGAPRNYFVYLPQGYENKPSTRWPVLFFLHGNGERGDGEAQLDYLLVNGPLYEAWVQKRDLPFVIVAPQLPMYDRDQFADYLRNRDPSSIPRRKVDGVPPRPAPFATPQPMTGALSEEPLPVGPEGPPMGWPELEADVLQILKQVQTDFRVDPARHYLTGVSYGGFGTWYLASRHPETFAAIAPVVGYGHPVLMEPIARAQTPIWCFAGGRDRAVPAQYFYPGLNRLESLGHNGLKFTIEADMGHDVWSRVYAGRDLYAWLLQQALPNRNPSPPGKQP